MHRHGKYQRGLQLHECLVIDQLQSIWTISWFLLSAPTSIHHCDGLVTHRALFIHRCGLNRHMSTPVQRFIPRGMQRDQRKLDQCRAILHTIKCDSIGAHVARVPIPKRLRANGIQFDPNGSLSADNHPEPIIRGQRIPPLAYSRCAR